MIVRTLMLSPLFAALVFAAGCGSATEANEDTLEETTSAESAVQSTIPFRTFSDTAPAKTAETRKIITSAAQYRAIVGHEPPVRLQWSREWVAFYSAGVQKTGGFNASIERIGLTASGRGLVVTTRLESPGAGCAVTESLTNPQTFVTFRRPTPTPSTTTFKRVDEVKACSECAGNSTTNPATGACECTALGRCITGYVWNADAAVCGCVPAAPACGAASMECPGAGTCVTGQCACNALAACIPGYRWDSSPSVCGCVSDAPSCGASTTCPGAGTCASGACACNAMAACIPGFRWDASPAVCGCVSN
jgi:hypothetical protein